MLKLFICDGTRYIGCFTEEVKKRVASVCQEKEINFSKRAGGVIDWKGGWEKLVILGLDSRISSVVYTVELLKKELVLKTV